jgi:hypothetical protein
VVRFYARRIFVAATALLRAKPKKPVCRPAILDFARSKRAKALKQL